MSNENDNRGIDYGLGKTNIDPETGIRFGVIHQNEIGNAWFEDSEPEYGPTCCPHCGSELAKTDDIDRADIDGDHLVIFDDVDTEYYCLACNRGLEDDELQECAEPLGFYVHTDDLKSHCGESGDIFVTESKYFTYAQFCSPCAPGAVSLCEPLLPMAVYGKGNAHDKCGVPLENNRGYCFSHDWFEGSIAPYPVFSVETGKQVRP